VGESDRRKCIIQFLKSTPCFPAQLKLIDKIKGKSSQERLLQQATGISNEIDTKTEAIGTIDDEVTKFRAKIALQKAVVKGRFDSDKKKLEEKLNSDQNELDERLSLELARQLLAKEKLSAQIAELEGRPDYRGKEQMAEITSQLRSIERWTSSLKEVVTPPTKDPDAKSCFEAPQTVFSCQKCENWVCGACKEQLANCPTCRVSLTNCPLRRNQTAERLLARM
jgi:hypothetical protein